MPRSNEWFSQELFVPEPQTQCWFNKETSCIKNCSHVIRNHQKSDGSCKLVFHMFSLCVCNFGFGTSCDAGYLTVIRGGVTLWKMGSCCFLCTSSLLWLFCKLLWTGSALVVTWSTTLLFATLMHSVLRNAKMIHSFLPLKQTNGKLCNGGDVLLLRRLRWRKCNRKNMDERNPVCFLLFTLRVFRDALLTMHSHF